MAISCCATGGSDGRVYQLDHFTCENGGEIPDMRVGYATWGTLSAAKDNAILLVPGTSGNRHGYDAHIGAGQDVRH